MTRARVVRPPAGRWPAGPWLLAGLLSLSLLTARELHAQTPGDPGTDSPMESPIEPPSELPMESQTESTAESSSVVAPSIFGPLPISDSFVLALGGLQLQMSAPVALEHGQSRWEVTTTVANSQAQSDVVEENLEWLLDETQRVDIGLDFLRDAALRDPDGRIYHVDGEVNTFELRWRRGLGRGWEAGLDLPVHKIGGGFLDGLVEDFHQLIAVDQDGRAGLAQNGYRIYFLDLDSESLRTQEPGTGFGDVRLRVKRELESGIPRLERWGHVRQALEATVKAPTGDRRALYSSGSWDFGLQWNVGLERERSSWFASAGVVRVGDSESLRLDASWLTSGHLAYEWRKGPRHAFSAQLSGWQSPLETLDLIRLSDRGVFYLTLGWHIRTRPGSEWFIALTENVIHFENSADLAFSAGWRQTLSCCRRSAKAPPLHELN